MDKRFALFAVLVFAVSMVFVFQHTTEEKGKIQKNTSASAMDWPMFRHDPQRTGNLNLTNKSYVGEILSRGEDYKVAWELLHEVRPPNKTINLADEFIKKTGLDSAAFDRIQKELNVEIYTVGSNAPEGEQGSRILDKEDVFDPSPIFADLNGDGTEELITWYKNTAKEPGDIVRRYSNKIIALELGKPGEDRGFPDIFARFPWLAYWEFVLPDEVHTSFAASDLDNDGYPEVVFGSDDGRIYALDNTARWYADLTTPKAILLWSYETEGKVRSTPAVADINNDGKKEVLFGSDDGNFYCLDKNGRLIWRYIVGEKIESSPAVYDGMVFFGSDDGNLYALDAQGALLWEYTTNGKIRSSPLVYNDSISFGSDDGNLYVLHTDGKVERIIETGSMIRASPLVYKDQIVSVSADGSVYFIGKGVKKLEIGTNILGTPSSNGEYLIVMDTNATIYKVYETEGSLTGDVFRRHYMARDIGTYLNTSVSLAIGNGFTAGPLIKNENGVEYALLFIYVL